MCGAIIKCLIGLGITTVWCPAWAQAPNFNDLVVLQDPTLSVTVSPLGPTPLACEGYLSGSVLSGFPPTLLSCVNGLRLQDPRTGADTYQEVPIGADAAGDFYTVVGTDGGPACFGGDARAAIHAARGSDPNYLLAGLNLRHGPGLPGPGDYIEHFAMSVPFIDQVQGTINILASGVVYVYPSCSVGPIEYAKVKISGLPRMFDALLTFVPPGQSLSVLIPGLPDVFRSADSMQVWTGDVRSMPDWSKAQPLTCNAATSPTPGQVVTVADALPDPEVGTGRYYLVASQRGSDRRLGRQYVNGAFSARNPASLPVCAP